MRPRNTQGHLHRNKRGGLPLTWRELIGGTVSVVVLAAIIAHNAMPHPTTPLVLDSRLVVEAVVRPV